MGKILLSAFSDEFADSFDEQLAGMRDFGIDYIELRHVDKINVSALTERQVAQVKQKLVANGIRVSAIGSPLGKCKLDEIDAHMETAKRVFETACALDTRLVRVFSFYAPAGKCITDLYDEVLSGMDRMLTLAESYGLTLCHENEAKIYGDVPARCRELLDAFGGRLKCVFDMGNYVLEGVDPYPTAYDLLKSDITYFHIKDALAAGAIVPPGCGEAHIPELLSTHAASAKEDFFVTLEPHLQTFSGLNALVVDGKPAFENPYQYPDKKAAFADAVTKIKEIIQQ